MFRHIIPQLDVLLLSLLMLLLLIMLLLLLPSFTRCYNRCVYKLSFVWRLYLQEPSYSLIKVVYTPRITNSFTAISQVFFRIQCMNVIRKTLNVGCTRAYKYDISYHVITNCEYMYVYCTHFQHISILNWI